MKSQINSIVQPKVEKPKNEGRKTQFGGVGAGLVGTAEWNKTMKRYMRMKEYGKQMDNVNQIQIATKRAKKAINALKTSGD